MVTQVLIDIANIFDIFRSVRTNTAYTQAIMKILSFYIWYQIMQNVNQI